MRRRPSRWVPAILLLLAVAPGTALARTPSASPDPAAIALIARSIVATRAATSMHVTITGSGPVAGMALMKPATLDGARMEADIDVARPAFSAEVDAPFLGWSGLGMRALDGHAYSGGGSAMGGMWVGEDATVLGDRGILGSVPGVGMLLDGDSSQAALENAIRRKLSRAGASIALAGERSCGAGTCTLVHLEGPLSADPTGLADLIGPQPDGTIEPGDFAILADVLVDTATARIDTVDVTLHAPTSDTTVQLTIGAYDEPVTIEAPPADQITENTGG
ncbi:MAG: hypothetical protein U0869_15300 [Chloroflexota bacterium]